MHTRRACQLRVYRRCYSRAMMSQVKMQLSIEAGAAFRLILSLVDITVVEYDQWKTTGLLSASPSVRNQIILDQREGLKGSGGFPST
jgi:hypothetical protein